MEVSGSASRPGHFTLGEKDPGAYWTGSCIGPKVSVDSAEEKHPCSCQESNLMHPRRSLLAILTELS